MEQRGLREEGMSDINPPPASSLVRHVLFISEIVNQGLLMEMAQVWAIRVTGNPFIIHLLFHSFTTVTKSLWTFPAT